MTLFQFFLLIIAGAILYLFFRQIFSGNYPKRGVDFEANTQETQIGGINRPDKIFSNPKIESTRIDQLLQIADTSVQKGDMLEASKALQSALILEPNHLEALQKYGYVMLQTNDLQSAKESFEKLIELDATNDIAHASLANVLHALKDDAKAEFHHQCAIEIDGEYAPHYFNYANTLYDLNRKMEALAMYKKAYKVDNSLQSAREMIMLLS